MKILVCGLPGSGKTWLSERLVKHIDNCAWYNADFVRKYANDWDFELTGRMRQANRMKTFADFEKSNGRWVVCDFVAPTEKARTAFGADFLIWIDTINQGRVVSSKLDQLNEITNLPFDASDAVAIALAYGLSFLASTPFINNSQIKTHSSQTF